MKQSAIIVIAVLACILLQLAVSVQTTSKQLTIARGGTGKKSDPVEYAELDADDDRNIKVKKQGRRLTREAEAQASILNGATGSDAPTDGERALICMSGSPAKRKADSDPQLSQAMAYNPRVMASSLSKQSPKEEWQRFSSSHASAPPWHRLPGSLCLSLAKVSSRVCDCAAQEAHTWTSIAIAFGICSYGWNKDGRKMHISVCAVPNHAM